MARPLISVLQMGYNQAARIEPSLRAVLAQDYSPLEIVFSDDCSTDATFEVMQRVAAEYRGPHRIVLNRNPENLGIVGNFNAAAALCSGALIVQANGDDISLPHRVSRLVEAWSEDPDRIKLVYSDAERIDLEGRVLGPAVSTNMTGSTWSVAGVLDNHGFVAGACVAFTPDLIKSFGPVPSCAIVEDHVLPFRALHMGRIVRVPEVLVQWRTGGISWLAAELKKHPVHYYGGETLKVARRLSRNLQAHLIDGAGRDYDGKTRSEARARAYIARTEFLLDTAAQPLWKLVLRTPYAYGLTLLRNERQYIRLHLRYLLRPICYPLRLRRWQNEAAMWHHGGP